MLVQLVEVLCFYISVMFYSFIMLQIVADASNLASHLPDFQCLCKQQSIECDVFNGRHDFCTKNISQTKELMASAVTREMRP